MNKYINLLRHLAWSFHYSTGVDWKELYSEAVTCYFETINQFDKNKGKKESVWVYLCVRNGLINFCKEEKKHCIRKDIEEVWDQCVYFQQESFEISEQFSPDSKFIIEMVLSNPERYEETGHRKAQGQISRDLYDLKGWKYTRVWESVRVLRKELNNLL